MWLFDAPFMIYTGTYVYWRYYRVCGRRTLFYALIFGVFWPAYWLIRLATWRHPVHHG